MKKYMLVLYTGFVMAGEPSAQISLNPVCNGIVNQQNALYQLKDTAFLNSAFSSMEDAAKNACTYKIKPQTITVSIGFISATWQTEDLCKPNK